MKLGDIERYEKSIGCTMETLGKYVHAIALIPASEAKTTWRRKNAATLAKKKKLKQVEDVLAIDDVYGIRILVDTVEEAYSVLQKVQQYFDGYIDHDYIQQPKTRSDRPGAALRLLQFIARKNNATFEIQITTKEFNEANEILHAGYSARKYT